MKVEYSIATLGQLKAIPVIENDESIVSLNDLEPFILCNKDNKDMLPYTGQQVFVRAKLRDKIIAAQIALKNHHPEMRLFINYGYRHPHVQTDYYLKMYDRLKQTHTGSESALEEKVHLYIAHPSVGGHPACAAIDATIYLGNEELDMGCKICDFDQPSKIPTFSEFITETQQKNRVLLHDILVDQGFAPYYGEWWHFSYGDREWAAFYKQPHALYSQINFSL